MTQDTSRRPDLVIIGGGIHGCATALFSAMRGLSVTVLEKDTVARHASGVNAGGVRRLGRDLAEVAISVRSMEIWRGISDLLDDDCGFQVAPQIKVAETEAQLEGLRDRAATLRGLGFTHEVVLERDALRQYLPAVADHVVGGLACLEDGFAQPFWTTTAFRRKAERLGVQFVEGIRATDVSRAGGVWQVSTDDGPYHAENVMIAAGAWSGALAARLGEHAPVEAIAPLMLVTARLPHFCDAVVGGAGRPLSFKQMPNGTVVVGGGRRGIADPATNKSEILFSELQQTAQTAIDIFPIMSGASIVRSWSGVEACMPDQIPVVGPSAKHEGIFYGFGYSAMGSRWGRGSES